MIIIRALFMQKHVHIFVHNVDCIFTMYDMIAWKSRDLKFIDCRWFRRYKRIKNTSRCTLLLLRLFYCAVLFMYTYVHGGNIRILYVTRENLSYNFICGRVYCAISAILSPCNWYTSKYIHIWNEYVCLSLFI